MRFPLLSQRGQGLIEATVAIGIIVTAIVASVSLVNFTLRSTTSTENRLLATQLALEGIEVAVHIRDSNYLAGQPFDTGLTSGGDNTAIAVFDETSNTWSLDFSPNALSDQSAVLYRAGGIYRQNSSQPTGQATPFRRLLTISAANPGELTVTSTVEWKETTGTHQASVDRILYDWR